MSVYPGAIDTDATLFIAKDNIQTELSSKMAAGDTVAVVANPAGWVANMIASVEAEQMLVTGTAGNIITVTRGFAGTTAAAHASGKNFSNFVDAAYQSSLKSSLIAVETALGPNLSNISVVQELYTPLYDVSPAVSGSGVTVSGGNLIIGNNSLSFAKVPPGVNGTDIGHYLYVSGGTGTAEACLITGGAGRSGDANGQIIIQCANTHSGAWQIQSATQGVQEALNSCVNGLGAIRMPAGLLTFHAPVTISDGFTISGSGMNTTTILVNPINGGAFDVRSYNGGVYRDFRIWGPDYSTQQTAGGYGFRMNGYDASTPNYASHFSGIQCYNLWDGILCQKAYNLFVHGCMFTNCGNSGITLSDTLAPDSDGGAISDCSLDWFAGPSKGWAGVNLLSTGGIRITGCKFSGYQWGVYESGGHSSGLMIANNDFENLASGCIALHDTYGRFSITGNSLTTFDPHPTLNYWAVFLAGAQYGTITGNNFYAMGDQAVAILAQLSANNWMISGNQFFNFLFGVYVDDSCTQITVGPNQFTQCASEVPVGTATLVSLPGPIVFAHINEAWMNGSVVFVTDGKVTSATDNTLIGGGTGALAVRINGVWRAFVTQN